MNPSANEWKPSVSATAFVPGQGFQVSTPSSAPAPAQDAAECLESSNLSDIDENDPLWKTVLKICEGDRGKAVKMISDPDSLAKYPEVEAILLAGGGDVPMDTTDDNEEKSEDTQQDEDPLR
jgi:hypothetical protein